MAGQPIHRGNINAEIAKLAESALRENGKKETAEGYPFAIIECEDLTATQAVKEKAEQILEGESVTWGKAIVTQEWSEKVPGSRRGGTPGFVVLSEAGNLPWGEECERGDIYTWNQITRWDCKAGCYLLSFTIKEK